MAIRRNGALGNVPSSGGLSEAMGVGPAPERIEHLGQVQPGHRWDLPPAVPADRPKVTLHYAQTLDGRIATRTGNSQWIGGPAALRLTHELRAANQAVMVGVGTILADNPRLTVRLVPGRSPKRIILDTTLRIPLDAYVLTDGRPTLVATTSRAPADRIAALRARGADVVMANQDAAGRVDLSDLLQTLAGLGITSVLLEGGAGLITSALRDGLVDRLIVSIAPKVIGAGIEAVGNLNIQRLTEALNFTEARFTLLERDVIFEGRLVRAPARAG